jgi:hypothetical protein
MLPGSRGNLWADYSSDAEEAPTIAQRAVHRQLVGEKAPLREAVEARVDARF